MKQYTNESQTAKLIELGLEEPKTKLPFEVSNDELGYTYSIGELIGMLPITIREEWYQLEIKVYLGKWKVSYIDITNDSPIYYILEDDLIDAIFNMIVKLKEEKLL